MAKLNPKVIGLSAGATGGLLSIICALLILIVPGPSMRAFQSMFHGIDMMQLVTYNLTAGSFIGGAITAAVIGFIAGWLFAVVYNYMAAKVR